MRLSPRTAFLALLAALALAPVVLGTFQVIQMNYIAVTAVIVLGLVLLTGVMGVMSFGQQVFAGMAAYASAVLCTRLGLSPWVGLLAGFAIVAVAAVFLGSITLRLSGHYLAISTIAWGLAVYFLFGNLELLGKHTGITQVPPITIGPWSLESPRAFYVFAWSVLVVLLLLCANLLDSRTGRAMRALRTRALMAESFGVDAFRLRMTVFLIAALLAGFSGWLHAHLLRFVSPGAFNVHIGIEYLFMMLVGGATSVWGALLGSGLIAVLKERLTTWLPHGAGGNYEIVVLGALLLVLLHRTTAGLAPLLSRRFLRQDRGEPVASAEPLPRRARSSAPTLLEVHGVSRRFGGLRAVDALSFRVDRGEILGLVGPNGAGKSTMFNLVTGVLRCDGGEIRFLGQRIDGASPARIATQGIARTFQHVNLVGTMSVLDNVAIGAHLRGRCGPFASMVRADRAEERRLLAEAARQIERVGLGAHLHDPAGDLPLGKQRLVEVARALCADPLLLLLDEPAAGLRHAEKQGLAQVLDRLRDEGVALLLVEHDMDFLMGLVDRVVVMKLGQLLATGTPAEVGSDPAVIDAYLGSAT